MTADIALPLPSWNSDLHKVILELEVLRQRYLHSEVPPYIFLQLKNIFQTLETLGSARIEGNNTTLAEYVEKIIDQGVTASEKQQELDNIEQAISFIEEKTSKDTPISRAYLSELHKVVVQGLASPPAGEGSRYPGKLRPINVRIESSDHAPPDVATLEEYFEKLLEFINADHAEQNQLLVVALAHHRFMHIPDSILKCNG